MIHFDNISKRYPGGHEALSQINLRLEKGQMAFLTGHSGAGKSTVFQMILRFHDPQAGRITFDGIDIREPRVERLSGDLARAWVKLSAADRETLIQFAGNLVSGDIPDHRESEAAA